MAKKKSEGTQDSTQVDINNLIEQSEPNIQDIQQTTAMLIEASRTVLKAKMEDEELYQRCVEEFVRKKTENGKKEITNTNSLNALKLNALKKYHKLQADLRQQALNEEIEGNKFKSRSEMKEWEAGEKYRITKQFEDDRKALREQIAMAGTRVKEKEKLEKELTDRLHKYECDMIKQELSEKKKAADEEYEHEMDKIRAKEFVRTKVNDLETDSGMDADSLSKVKGAKSAGENELIGVMKKLSSAVNVKDNLKAKSEASQAAADAAAKRLEAKKEEYEMAKEANARGELSDEELAQIFREGQELQIEATNAANEANLDKMASKIADAVAGEYKEQYGKATSILNDYMGSIDARLQGSGEFFYKVSGKISTLLGVSPFVKTTKVLEEMKKAVEQGIAYNIEERAFLAGISDKIATTFDAFDSNLMRIIRLQQADTTASRLGMEAYLTKMLNKMYQDSSYLTSAMDTVTAALIDATSLMGYKQSAEFEFVVQKWLGALSSLGLSDSTVGELAKGINYLATGDVQNLANNTSLQTMFAMAASEANLEYSELLLNGLSPDDTNKLLEHVVRYLKKIAEDSENQVVRQAYGDIFNLTASDMMAIRNITAGEIQTLSNNMLTYNRMESETDSQLLQVILRTSLGAMLDNVYENVLYGVASDMANNPVTFAMQKMLDFMEDTQTDIAIPFINVYGFGLDINATVKDIMQMGLGIGQAFSLMANVLGGLASGGGLFLDMWGGKETTRRGSGGLALSTGGTLGSASSSLGSYSSSGNAEDMKKDSVSGAASDSEETKKDMGQKDPEYTMETLFKQLVTDGGKGEYIKAKVSLDEEPMKKLLGEITYKVNVTNPYADILNGISGKIKDLTEVVGTIHTGLSKTVYSELSISESSSTSTSTAAPAAVTTLSTLQVVDANGNPAKLTLTLPDNMKVELGDISNQKLATKIKEALFDTNEQGGSLYTITRLLNATGIPVMTMPEVKLGISSDSAGGGAVSPPPNQ